MKDFYFTKRNGEIVLPDRDQSYIRKRIMQASKWWRRIEKFDRFPVKQSIRRFLTMEGMSGCNGMLISAYAKDCSDQLFDQAVEEYTNKQEGWK